MNATQAKSDFLNTHGLQHKVILVDAEPDLAGPENEGVTHVLYAADGDETVVYVRKNEKWEKRTQVEGISREMAQAHYDQMTWRLFRKHDTAERKKSKEEVTRDRLRRSVRYFYNLQKLRIQSGNRGADGAETAVLDEDDKEFFSRQSAGLQSLEKSTLAEVEYLLKSFPIYAWLKDQKGCGPTMSGVIVSEIDIARCDTPSALWAYCGLHVDTATGRSVRRERGKRANWNPFLKTKLVFVLASCLIKAKSPWTKFYYDYKTRKENQLVDVCMLCEGKGALQEKDGKATPCAPDAKGAEACYNCEGKGRGVPWGRGPAHRDMAARRYMVKMFLLELWLKWREVEGLPVTESYAEAKLGRKHGDHAKVG